MTTQRRVLLATLAIPFLVLAGCDLFTTTPFPPYLTYVSAELDLDGEIPAAVRSVELEAIAAEPGGERFFSIYVEPDSAENEVYILIDQDLSVRFVETSETAPPFDTRLFVTTLGRIQKGRVVYDPTTNEILNSPRIDDDDSNPAVLTDSTKYYVYKPNDADVEIVDYSAGFVQDGTTTVDAISDDVILRDVTTTYRWESNPSDPEFALFLRDENDRVFRSVIAVADVASPAGPLVDVSVDPVLPSIDLDSLQDTPQGILGKDYQTLYRINRDTGGVQDSFDLGESARNEDSYPVVFDPAGEFYILFDEANRTLYRVSPWW